MILNTRISLHLFDPLTHPASNQSKKSIMSFSPITLNSANLNDVAKLVKCPTFNRSKVKTGIVHVGIGGFHRSHQAYYTNLLMEQHGETNWGICGIALLKYDKKIYDTLVAQDGLYTLIVVAPDGTPSATVIGAITEYLYAPEDSEAVIEKMASPDIKIVTLTITEGGYNMNAATGEFQLDNPSIQKDISNPSSPETIFGFLTQALKRRRDRGIRGVTVQSCDNIQQNGEAAKKMFCAYVQAAEPDLLVWMNENVTFPNAMVDRITPVTTPGDIATLKQRFQVEDAWPVVCEPFIQWVIEDSFVSGRPPWDRVGAQFVSDVHAYEKMKIRLLNGSHTVLAMTAILQSFTYVYEAMADPLLASFLFDFMKEEVVPILDPVPGIDLDAYCVTVIERFANTNIKDQLTRIVSETSAKAPKFLVATITDQLARCGNVSHVKRAVLVLAAWCHYLELSAPDTESGGEGYLIQDSMSEVLVSHALASMPKQQQQQQEEGTDKRAAFLHVREVFGDLVENSAVVALYVKLLGAVRSDGIVHVMKNLENYD